MNSGSTEAISFYCLSVSSLIKNKTQQQEVISTPNCGHIKYLKDQIQPVSLHCHPITPQFVHEYFPILHF